MTTQLVTLAQAKQRLSIDPLETDDDALLEELIDQASDEITGYTGRALAPEAGATYYVDTSAGSTIAVPRGIRAVTYLGVSWADQPDTGGTYTSIDLDRVLLRPSPIDRLEGWPATQLLVTGGYPVLASALNGAKITGDFGWATTPALVQGVALDLVTDAYTRRKGGGEQLGPDDVSAPVRVSMRVQLRRYRAGLGIA